MSFCKTLASHCTCVPCIAKLDQARASGTDEVAPEVVPNLDRNAFTACFDISWADRFRGKVEALYSVEMKHVRRGFACVSPESHLDALRVNTGNCRIFSRSFPAAKVFKVAWHSWPQWRPEGEPDWRGAVSIFGVPWHVSKQLGVVDSLLFSPIERPFALKCTGPTKLPPEQEMKDLFLKRAATFGFTNVSAMARADGFQLHVPKKSLMPDPFSATADDLEPFLAPLLQENPGEEEACLKLARWKFALQQRQSYLPQLARPGYGNDLPFYSVVEPLKQLFPLVHLADDAHITAVPYDLAHPPVEDFHRRLKEASRPVDAFAFDSIQELARIQLVKSAKMSLAMPMRRWCGEIEGSEETSVKWEELQPWALLRGSTAERKGQRRWPSDLFPWWRPDSFSVAQPSLKQIVAKLRKLSEVWHDMTINERNEREASRIAVIKSIKKSFERLTEDELVLWSWNFDEFDSSPEAMVRWIEVEPSTLREHFDADNIEIPWNSDFTGEAWSVMEDGLIAADDSGIENMSEERFAIPWNNDFTGGSWEVLPDGLIAADHGSSNEESEEWVLTVPWNCDCTGAAWVLLPDHVIATDSDVDSSGRSWEWTDELRKKHKLPATWNNVQLVPEDYTPEVALQKLHHRCEEFRLQRETHYEELVRCGEMLVQWPSQGAWPKVEKTAKHKKVIAMLDLRYGEGKNSACNQFEPQKRQPLVMAEKDLRSTPETNRLSSFGRQILSQRADAPSVGFGSARRWFQSMWCPADARLTPGPGLYTGGSHWEWCYNRFRFGPQQNFDLLSTQQTAPRYSFHGSARFARVPRYGCTGPGPGQYYLEGSLKFKRPIPKKDTETAPKVEETCAESCRVRQQQALRGNFSFCDFVATGEEEAPRRCKRQETWRRDLKAAYDKRFLEEWESYGDRLQHQTVVLKIRAQRTLQQEQGFQDALANLGEPVVFRCWQADEEFPKQVMTARERKRYDCKLSSLRDKRLQGGSGAPVAKLSPEKQSQDVVATDFPDCWRPPAHVLRPCAVYVRRCKTLTQEVWCLEETLQQCKVIASRVLGQMDKEAGISSEMIFAMVLLTSDFHEQTRKSDFFTVLNKHLRQQDPNFLQSCNGYFHFLIKGLSRLPQWQGDVLLSVEEGASSCYQQGRVGVWKDFTLGVAATPEANFAVPTGAGLVVRINVSKTGSRSRDIGPILSDHILLLPNFKFQAAMGCCHPNFGVKKA